MGSPFVGEIRMFAGNFAPSGWAFCNGQLMPISQNEALFNLIGTTYGGDGVSTFALPSLQSRVPIHMGTDRQGTVWVEGQISGTENVTLLVTQIPAHTHSVMANASGGSSVPTSNLYGGGQSMFSTNTPSVAMSNLVVAANAGSQPHANIMPFLAVSFIISLFGIFPSRN
jgi:microcystin-dependent protein